MLKIGLTVGIASGKSTVCQRFTELGITVIDADIIARQLVEPGQTCLEQIVTLFGPEILHANGQLDRGQLRELIFTNAQAKQQLEQILHPAIRQQLLEQSNNIDSAYCILSVPLLIESNMTTLVDRVLVIETTNEKQVQRVCTRDGVTAEQAKAIINSQCSPTQRKQVADDIIINDQATEPLIELVSELHKKYLKMAKAII